MKYNKWPLYTGDIGAAAILAVQVVFSLSFVDQSQRSPSIAPLLSGALISGLDFLSYRVITFKK